MARIRTIKPEIWTSEQFVECSTNARLLFVGLLNFCDDGGVHVASVKRLKMEVFPGDPFNDKDVSGWIEELLRAGLIGLFESQGQQYWWVTGWDKHQRIDRPNRKHRGPFDEGSTIIRRGLDDHSPPEGSLREKESKGREEAVSSEQQQAAGAEPPVFAANPSAFTFPVTGKGPPNWSLPEDKLIEYRAAYPSLDVDTEMRKARQWCLDNPKRRKTSGRGMLSFLTGWLNRATNHGNNHRGPPEPDSAPKVDYDYDAYLESIKLPPKDVK